METKELYKVFKKSSGISTDTRKIIKNCIFFCLTGDKFDGNKFADEALKKGAKKVVVDNPLLNNPNFIVVKDALKSLQNLAKHHRLNLKNTNVIGLTGSNGKTTTKELIHKVLCSKYKTISTFGNLNNHIGVPLSLLKIKDDSEFAVIEMGANRIGEIEFLSDLVQPDYGYITNFGKAHLEGFGSFEGVVIGKTELYKWINKNKKKLFINGDNLIQKKFIDENAIVFGQDKNFQFEFQLVSNDFVDINYKNINIKSNLFGAYNSYNVMCAISVGLFFNIDINTIKKVIEKYTQKNNRSQIISQGNKKIILDAYNANPTSMKLSIDSFLNFQDKKLLILGDMFELGEYSFDEHMFVIKYIENKKNTKSFLVGNEFYKHKKESLTISFYKTKNDLKKFISKNKIKETSILIKGSRSMQMEDLINTL
tara:strand:- start:273 stop:1544 length:1272 start_codon:yes stop_codon:yes gene_type:complete